MLRSLFDFDFDWMKSDAHLLLLSEFSSPRQIDDFSKHSEWKDILGEKPRKAIERFINDGYIEKGDLSFCLAYKFKVSELKELLRERNLKLSGTKDELIHRLIQTDAKGMEKLVRKMELYKLTNSGKIVTIIKKYKDLGKTRSEILSSKEVTKWVENSDKIWREQVETAKKQQLAAIKNVNDVERKNAEELTIHALQRKKYKNASKIMANYEIDQLFPRRMGIEYDTKDDEVVLRNIFNKKPNQLEKYNDEQLGLYRIAAGMFHLGSWDRCDIDVWLSINQAEKLEYEPDVIAFMLFSHASHLTYMDNTRELEKRGYQFLIRIINANDEYNCKECKRIASKSYTSVSEVPLLPYEACISEIGCRCKAFASFRL